MSNDVPNVSSAVSKLSRRSLFAAVAGALAAPLAAKVAVEGAVAAPIALPGNAVVALDFAYPEVPPTLWRELTYDDMPYLMTSLMPAPEVETIGDATRYTYTWPSAPLWPTPRVIA